MLFVDRKEGGGKLALALSKYQENKETIVLGLARGGVVVAAEVAKALNLPLGVSSFANWALRIIPSLRSGRSQKRERVFLTKAS